MNATALLLVIIGVFIILNAGNLAQVVQGNAHFSFQGSGSRSSNTTVTVPHGASAAGT